MTNCKKRTINWTTNKINYKLGYYELFDGYQNIDCLISIRPLEPNPDNVALIIGNQMFYRYCVTLDYEHNQIGFALSNFLKS